MRLTTLARVKRLLALSTTQHDAWLNQRIVGVSERVQRCLGRHVLRTSRTEDYDVEPGQTRVFLKGWPVDSGASFYNDYTREFTGSAIATTAYHVNNDYGAVVFDKYALVDGPGVFRATYSGGLAATLQRLVTVATVTQAFASNETITGATSEAQATWVSTNGTTLTMDVLFGAFEAGETLSGSTGGAATLTSLTTEPLLHTHAQVCEAVEAQLLFEFTRKREVGVSSISVEGGSYSIDPAYKLLRGVVEMLGDLRSQVERG